MSDDDGEDAEDDAPAVELGEGPAVGGQPIARVASRLTWPAMKSDVIEQEGDATVRTPDGPQQLETVLEDVDTPMFDTRRSFVESVRDAVSHGPVATE